MSTDLLIDALIDALITLTVVTKAKPIMRAAAVAAVRRGLRIAFCCASRPGVPNTFGNSPPSTRTTGVLITGASIAMPRNTAAAPPPSRASGWLVAPAMPDPMAIAPPAVKAPPTQTRMRSDRCGSDTSSRIAATGGIFAARRAGKYADSTVTTMPTVYAHRTGVAVNTSGADVSEPLKISACSSCARPTPRPRPIVEPRMPTATASPITAPVTCRREAPTARSSASSLVRWATSIEKVLKMMNAPTKIEISANTSRKIRKNDSAFATWLLASARIFVPVIASAVPGSVWATRSRSTVSPTPVEPMVISV